MSDIQNIKKEIERRRTFAIVSHPDAGKTTLTEKLLFFGGAVHVAGSVTARKNQRATTSDWMELERKRGISISSTVLSFEYEGRRINLVDTPGHKDFSEDTYRVLTAVDAAIMVIDAAKGIESQTRKLFEVCRQRGVPIFTFINKLDRPCREPLALLDELESVLGIGACPMNWPLGTGFEFKGVWDRASQSAHFMDRDEDGSFRWLLTPDGIDDPALRNSLGEAIWRTTKDEMEILEAAGEKFDAERVLRGNLTPVFFGSALNNFGVQMLLDGFVTYAPPPTPRLSRGEPVEPRSETFSAFVFKIQANMDPKHRDRVAFLRVVSGRFSRDMSAHQTRTGKVVRLANSSTLFGRERETLDEAFAGDVVGIVGASSLLLGDTLSTDPSIEFNEIPWFPPECFAYLHNPAPSNYKRFRTGLDQLLQEGVVHSFELDNTAQKIPLLSAVGPLQFEIVQYRLESEYGAASRLETAPWTRARWVDMEGLDPSSVVFSSGMQWATDGMGRRVLLFTNEWQLGYFAQNNKNVVMSEYPLDQAPVMQRA